MHKNNKSSQPQDIAMNYKKQNYIILLSSQIMQPKSRKFYNHKKNVHSMSKLVCLMISRRNICIMSLTLFSSITN